MITSTGIQEFVGCLPCLDQRSRWCRKVSVGREGSTSAFNNWLLCQRG